MNNDLPIRLDGNYLVFNPLFMVDVIMLLEGFEYLDQDEESFVLEYINEQVGKVSSVSGDELTLQVESGPIGDQIISLLERAVQGPLDELEKLINENRKSMREAEEAKAA